MVAFEAASQHGKSFLVLFFKKEHSFVFLGPSLISTAAQIAFGANGNAVPYQLDGWADPNDNGTWCLGPEAGLRVPLAPGQGELFAEFVLQPLVRPPALTGQRIALLANGALVGDTLVQIESAVGFRIGRQILNGGGDVELTVRCPDATSPFELGAGRDTRPLGFELRELRLMWVPPEASVYARRLAPLAHGEGTAPASMESAVHAVAGLPVQDLMLQFESLGYNCEMGLVQRRCGAEPLGLLRFSGISAPKLLEGLDYCFEGLDDPAELRLYPSWAGDTEWVGRNLRYDMHWHTYRRVIEAERAMVMDAEIRNIRFKLRRFLEVLETGQKLFVYQRPEHDRAAHVLPILNMLRSHGDNALLFVAVNHDGPPGSVDLLSADLYRGNIARVPPTGYEDDSDLRAWISICANAYRLWRETGRGG
jgi:hypothetical protein